MRDELYQLRGSCWSISLLLLLFRSRQVIKSTWRVGVPQKQLNGAIIGTIWGRDRALSLLFPFCQYLCLQSSPISSVAVLIFFLCMLSFVFQGQAQNYQSSPYPLLLSHSSISLFILPHLSSNWLTFLPFLPPFSFHPSVVFTVKEASQSTNKSDTIIDKTNV